jgi:hypothetical protein
VRSTSLSATSSDTSNEWVIFFIKYFTFKIKNNSLCNEITEENESLYAHTVNSPITTIKTKILLNLYLFTR